MKSFLSFSSGFLLGAFLGFMAYHALHMCNYSPWATERVVYVPARPVPERPVRPIVGPSGPPAPDLVPLKSD